MKGLFTNICKRVDVEVQSINAADRGTTCCLVLVKRVGMKRICCIGNLGDTRAIICSDKQIAKRVSIDHKVSNPSEVDRIKYLSSISGAKEELSLREEWLELLL